MITRVFTWGSRFQLPRVSLLAGVLGIAVVAASATGDGAHSATGTSPLTLQNPHVVVVKSKRMLHLFDGEKLVRSYAVDLGVAPIGPKRVALDGRTPEGHFRVVTKNSRSPFHRFVGIDYPNAPTVEWGLSSGLISPGAAASILDDLAGGRCPNWGTSLGGGIGLHGHRTGRNTTGGCIALSDTHVEELFSVLRLGDRVDILP